MMAGKLRSLQRRNLSGESIQITDNAGFSRTIDVNARHSVTLSIGTCTVAPPRGGKVVDSRKNAG